MADPNPYLDPPGLGETGPRVTESFSDIRTRQQGAKAYNDVKGYHSDVGLILKDKDAFNRVRTSHPHTLFDNKFIYGPNSLVWDEQTSGTASSTWDGSKAQILMEVGTDPGDLIIRQTKEYFNYEPGKSQLIIFTGVLGSAKAGVRSRYGYFDDNNGLYFEVNENGPCVVRRSYTSGSPVDELVYQEDWNLDRLDGRGPSSIIADFSKTQIFIVNFQWLGVGSVTFALNINEEIIPIHRMNHANRLTEVYMSTPCLPIRLELENVAETESSSELSQICCSVISEGGSAPVYIPFGAITDNPAGELTHRAVNNDGSYYPIISLRLKSSYVRSVIKLLDYWVIADTNDAAFIFIIINPSLTGASWVSAGASSRAEYDVSATALTGGTVLTNIGFSNQIRGVSSPIGEVIRLASNIAGDSDVLTIAGKSEAGAANLYAGINWGELT